MDKLFIFCIPTKENTDILKNLYILLAAGCKMGASVIRPVFMGQMPAINELQDWQAHYEQARNMRFLSERSREKIFCTRILEAYTITNSKKNEIDPSVELLKLFLLDDGQPYACGLEWEQDFRSNNPNIHVRITEKDGVIFLLDPTDSRQLVMAKLLFEKKWVKKVLHNAGVLVTCPLECCTPQQLDSLYYGLSLIRGNVNMTFLPDIGRNSFGYLLAATSIIDLSQRSVQGTVVLPNGVHKAYYEKYSISDISCTEVQNQLASFLIFANLMRGKYLPFLGEWKKRVNYDEHALALFTANEIINFFEQTSKWREEIAGDYFTLTHIDRSEEIVFNGETRLKMSLLFKKLNKVDRVSGAFNNAEKKSYIIDTLVSAAYQFDIFGNSSSPQYITQPIKHRKILQLDDWRKMPNPFALFTNYKVAFQQEKAEDMLQQRSFCLDLWEMFYRLSKREIEEYFIIEEIVTKDYSEGHYWDVLNTYDEYGDILQDNVCFVIRKRTTREIVAYSSPYTGFCIRNSDMWRIVDSGKVWFSPVKTEWSELCNRDIDFKLFLYRYVRLTENLDSAFIVYVEHALSQQEIMKAESEDFLSAYSEYRKHIAVNS